MVGRGFIIHLKRANARRSHVERLLKASPLPAEIVDGVDGSKLSASEISAVFAPDLYRPHYPFALRAAEIGCFLSHRRCWQKIVDQDLPFALVFEDDASLDQDIAVHALNLAVGHIQNHGYIQLPVRPVSGSPEVVADAGGIRLLRPDVIPLRLSGQLISQTAARELLRLTTVFDRPVDTFLQMFWLTGIRPLAVDPSGLTDRTQEAGGSTISRKKSIADRISREAKRYWYRRQIDKLSERADRNPDRAS